MKTKKDKDKDVVLNVEDTSLHDEERDGFKEVDIDDNLKYKIPRTSANSMKVNSLPPSTTSLMSSRNIISQSTNKINISTTYWTVSTGISNRTGYSCRECKQIIIAGSPICVRDGRKMRFFYHEACFSNDADPRTQSSSTVSQGKFTHVISESAPSVKGKGKWSTRDYGYNPRYDK